mgnify:CR=1 FL=1
MYVTTNNPSYYFEAVSDFGPDTHYYLIRNDLSDKDHGMEKIIPISITFENRLKLDLA